MQKNIGEIEKIISKLLVISKKYENLAANLEPSLFFNKWRFSQTEKYKLEEILSKIKALNPKYRFSKEKPEESFLKCKNAKEVLHFLNKKLSSFPVNI